MQPILLNMKRPLILLLALLTLLPWQPVGDKKKRAKTVQHIETVQTDTIVIVDTVWVESESALPMREYPRSDTWRTIRDDSMAVLESMSVNLDSLLHDWHSRKYLLYDSLCVGSGVNPDFPDSVYQERLSNLPTIVPMVYNQPVRAVIDRYASRSRALVSYMLGVMQFYSPIIEQALDFYDVPQELKYLPVIESAMNPIAVSRAGATGMWQFMYPTGKSYGLKLNSLVDERRDPIKATWAAAHHLRDMYDLLGDWTLAIAAYNCGAGNVNKAIHRSGGGKLDFWDIYWNLPRETRGYVPAFIAATYIMNYYAEHGICPMETTLPLANDTLMLHRNVYLQQISAVCDIDMEALRALNPQYKEDLIPAAFEPYSLRLPMDKIAVFIDKGDSVYAYQHDTFFPPKKVVEPKPVTNTRGSAKPGKGGYITPKIRAGESLGTIARKYGVTVSQLKKWNGLRSDRITAGRTLKIYK
jgi:membrane-bound lytic murein transglycosylase D